MKKLIYSALVATLAVGAVQSVRAEIYLVNGDPLPCSTATTFDCDERTDTPPETAVYNAEEQPIGLVSDYSYDLAD